MQLKHWTTTNGMQIKHLIAGRCNVYLLSKGDLAILVDTGSRKDYGLLENRLRESGWPGKGIRYLILTHTHYDHCKLASRLKEKYGCKIVVSAKAEASIKAGYTRLPNGTNFLSNTIVKMGRMIGAPKYGYEPFRADILIKGEYSLRVGEEHVEIIETPGHSKDSITILADEKYALVGDAMFGVLDSTIFPPFADDIKTMIRSWGTLLETGCRTFLPGHGKPVSRERLQRQYEKYVRKYRIE